MNPSFAEIFEKIPFTALLAIYLGWLGYGYYEFNNDDSSPLHVKQAEIVKTQQDITALKKKVKDANDFLQSLSAKKQQFHQLAQELEDTKTTLSDNVDVPDLMNTLFTEARRAGLSVASLKPGKKADQEFYSEQEFLFKSSGVFFQYVAFLDRVANFQKIVRVDEASFAPPSNSSPDAAYVRLNSEMHIKAYRYIGTKADELGKATSSPTGSGGAPAAAPGGKSPTNAGAPAKAGNA